MTEPRKKNVEDDKILDHNYDGIQEYDNPMPRWWLNVFYVTIVFSLIYVLNFIPGVGSGPGRVSQYEAEMAKAQDMRAKEAEAHPVTGAAVLALSHDPTAIAQGRERFKATCS